MVKNKKATQLKKASIAKKKVAKKTTIKKAVIKKKVVKMVASKKAIKSAAKKKAVISMKKTSARPAGRKKIAAKVTPIRSRTKELQATIAALKQELQELKRDLKYAEKKAGAMASLNEQRDVAVGKFLKSWDRKAILALEKTLKPKKRKI